MLGAECHFSLECTFLLGMLVSPTLAYLLLLYMFMKMLHLAELKPSPSQVPLFMVFSVLGSKTPKRTERSIEQSKKHHTIVSVS